MKYLAITAFICLSFGLYSQVSGATGSVKESDFDARLLRHYTVEELRNIQTNYPEKYTLMEYYYLNSYKIERLNCEECGNFPFTHFDIAHFENLRKKDSAYIREYKKYGYKVTIYPLNQLTYLTTLQEFRLNQ